MESQVLFSVSSTEEGVWVGVGLLVPSIFARLTVAHGGVWVTT